MDTKHKVFISYHHQNEQNYKDELITQNELYGLFQDYSVGMDEIDDSDSDETIRTIIRDEYIKDATVLILLCGKETKYRKFIDWELEAAMFDTEKNPKLGILVISVPEIHQSIRAGENEEKPSLSDTDGWFSISTREEYVKHYPYMPDRIIDNFVNSVPISVVEWNRIDNQPGRLRYLIDKAFEKRTKCNYKNDRPMMGRNKTI